MTVGEGMFQLYTHVVPPLKAGLYRFSSRQQLAASTDKGDLGPGDLGVQTLDTHVEVTSPRYLLPPDQVLSTFPPAGTEGAYGSRLPQVVIKRRTLPWERAITRSKQPDGTTPPAPPPSMPWLALVVIADGEAEVVKNAAVEECVTSGVTLGGPADVQTANYLKIRSSMVAKILPTQKDVPLLAHAREVDINDTELMMGDDDGFLAVVISNRLPVAGRGPGGQEVPVTYTAALISLEGKGQFDALLPKAPPHLFQTQFVVEKFIVAPLLATIDYDHTVMGMSTTLKGMNATFVGVNPTVDVVKVRDLKAISASMSGPVQMVTDHVPASYTGAMTWSQTKKPTAAAIYHGIDSGFSWPGTVLTYDPLVKFPVLLHWKFVSTGTTTFRKLMTELDSGLLGTVGSPPPDSTGRTPVEVVETGHVGLIQRTRVGDQVRAWYRGPLLAHPPDLISARLPLAHVSDQLRAVIPDGREDLSLAAAFEIGRLLALNSPTMVAALLRWRQLDFQAARQKSLWGVAFDGLRTTPGFDLRYGAELARHLGLGIAHTVAGTPRGTLGDPRPINPVATPLPIDTPSLEIVTRGLGLDLAVGSVSSMLDAVRTLEVPTVTFGDLSTRQRTTLTNLSLQSQLGQVVTSFASDALANQMLREPARGPTFPRTTPDDHSTPDVLDELLAPRRRPASPGTDPDVEDAAQPPDDAGRKDES